MIDCKYFGKCGGCSYFDLNEDQYRNEKIKLLDVKNNLNVAPEWIWVGDNTRRKITLQLSSTNQLGFFKEKSKEVVPINSCLVATKNISDFIPQLQELIGRLPHKTIKQISIIEFDNCLSLVFYLIKDLEFTQNQKVVDFARKTNCNISTHQNGRTSPIIKLQNNHININNFTLNLDSNIFIQATKDGLENIISIVANEIKSNPNIRSVADIYCGFGIYSFALARIVKNISCFEGSVDMTHSIKENIKTNRMKNIVATRQDVFQAPVDKRQLNKFDLALINPPRNGATPQIKEITKSNLNNLIYVSCNPETFFKDVEILINSGFKIKKLYALDQFYLTKHLELIGLFTK